MGGADLVGEMKQKAKNKGKAQTLYRSDEDKTNGIKQNTISYQNVFFITSLAPCLKKKKGDKVPDSAANLGMYKKLGVWILLRILFFVPSEM